MDKSEVSHGSERASESTSHGSERASVTWLRKNPRTEKETIETNSFSSKETDTHLSFLEIENNKIAKKTIQFIQKRTSQQKVTTFTDLERFIHAIIPTKGDVEILIPRTTTIVWNRINQRFVDIIMLIEKSKLVEFQCATQEDYGSAKKYPHYPVAIIGKSYTDGIKRWSPTRFWYHCPTLL